MTSPYDANFWNDRYGAAGRGYVYGTEPNEFLVAVADRIPPGLVLCLADGEGRNGVHLATLGHAVTSVDLSATGLAKARALAARRGVPLTTVVADLNDFVIAERTWAGIVAIFMHLPPALRAKVLARAAAGLRPGGVFVLECYSPAQMAFGTGGPRDVALLPTLAALRTELTGLEFLHGAELERDILEGDGHTGRGAVVQVIAQRPA
ncbi:MAG TPA: class I SAM-dependent methyltransferase [Lacunisphaera sp.]|nr:class I SAM-dependent methyltransferase [Lacunisphaera sp.]